MKVILIGCEYVGTTALAEAIRKWSYEVMDEGKGIPLYHDHWKIPHTSGHPGFDEFTFTDEEQEQVLALSPMAKEMIQRHSLYYHIQPEALRNDDYLTIGLHIENAIYAPLYFGYYVGDRAWAKRSSIEQIEHGILEFAPDMTLVLLKASPDTIARRMKESPHHNQVIREQDIERVLGEFETEYGRTAIKNKFTLDTTSATVEETLGQFVTEIEPFLSETDRVRILAENARKSGEWL